MVPGSHNFGYSRNNRILFFLNTSWLCHPNILAIVELALQMIHIFFQKYHCYFPKMYLLWLILFTIKVYARINIFKISFVRCQTFTHLRTKQQWYITNLLTYLNRISRVKEILLPFKR